MPFYLFKFCLPVIISFFAFCIFTFNSSSLRNFHQTFVHLHVCIIHSFLLIYYNNNRVISMNIQTTRDVFFFLSLFISRTIKLFLFSRQHTKTHTHTPHSIKIRSERTRIFIRCYDQIFQIH